MSFNSGSNPAGGHARVYQWDCSEWVQVGQDIDGESFLDNFGWSVSMSDDGEVIAIGSHLNDGDNGRDSGHVKIYEWNKFEWKQRGDTLNGDFGGDKFGYSICLNSSGDHIAIGGIGKFNKGHVKVFEFKNNNWEIIDKEIIGERVGDSFGNSVSLNSDGKVLIVGDPMNIGRYATNHQCKFQKCTSGILKVYRNETSKWNLVCKINGNRLSDYFGKSVDINDNGDVIAVGAYAEDTGNLFNCGSVRIYKITDSKSRLLGNTLYGTSTNDWFGSSVKLNSNGNRVAVSAINANDKKIYVNVYELKGKIWRMISTSSLENHWEMNQDQI